MSRPIPQLGLSISLLVHSALLLATLPGHKPKPDEPPGPGRNLEISLLAPEQAHPLSTKPGSISPPRSKGSASTAPGEARQSLVTQAPRTGTLFTQADAVAPAPTALADAAPPQAPVAQAPAPSESALTQRYARLLAERLGQPTDYPRVAAVRGWQGMVHIRVTLSRQGQLIQLQIASSSGFAVLDQHALARVREATPLPALTGNPVGEALHLVIPVQYRLERGEA